MERTVLLVDEVENVLNSLTRLLRRDGYRILRSTTTSGGLELLRENPDVGVIICDQRMPEMTGVQFLSEVREEFPDTVRIVLSGYTDLESVTSAINEGAIYKFLTKPWEDDQLRENIRKAFHHFELARENERLSAELKTVNAELEAMNEDLERRVERKTREVMYSLEAAQTSQALLEYLPVGVLGIDTDGMIALSNQAADDVLNGGVALAGGLARDLLPEPAYVAYERATGSGGAWSGAIELPGGKVEVLVSDLDGRLGGIGSVMILVTGQVAK